MLKKIKNNSLLLFLIGLKNNTMSRSSGYIYFFCMVFLFLIILLSSVSAKTEESKSGNMSLSPFNSSSDQIPLAEGVKEDMSPFSLMIKLYKRYLSPVNSSRCPMYPSCSNFASRALRYHGEKGLVMTFDRLLRCGRDLEDYTLLYRRGRILHYDPVIPIFKLDTDESSK